MDTCKKYQHLEVDFRIKSEYSSDIETKRESKDFLSLDECNSGLEGHGYIDKKYVGKSTR